MVAARMGSSSLGRGAVDALGSGGGEGFGSQVFCVGGGGDSGRGSQESVTGACTRPQV